MAANNKTLVVSGAAILAGILRFVSEILQNLLINSSASNLFGFGFAPPSYILFPVYYVILGFLLSFVLVNVLLKKESVRRFFLISIVFSIFTSVGHIQNVYEIIKRTNYLDKTYIQMDIFQICTNFVIFPLIAFFVWKAKDYFASNTKIYG